MTQQLIGDRTPPAQVPEHGCWAGGCLGGPLGAVLLPVAGFYWIMYQQIEADIVASFFLMYLIPVGLVLGILLGTLIGSIIYYVQRYHQRNTR